MRWGLAAPLAGWVALELVPALAAISSWRSQAFRLVWAVARLLPLLAGIVSLVARRRGAEELILGASLVHLVIDPDPSALSLVVLAAALIPRPLDPRWLLGGAAAMLGTTVLVDDALALRHLLQRYHDGRVEPLMLAARMAATVFVLRQLDRARLVVRARSSARAG